MERIEPTLIPQWLKGTGNVTGGATALHQTSSSSSLISDDHTTLKHARNRQANANGHDIGRSYNSDRTTSSYFRRSSSSIGSGHRAQSSFGWEREKYDSKEKDKSILGDFRRFDYSDPFDNILPNRAEKDLRRSQSLITGKRGESSPRKVSTEFNNNKSNHGNSNGLVSVSSLINTVQKTAFERDFPSLGADEKQLASEVRRVSSPVLTTAIQTLPTILGGDSWTSALAEVPVIVGSGSVQQPITSIAASSTTSSTIGVLNMAETVAHGPTRTNNTPQLPVGNQRLEELVLKQSRQLIPVIPAMPKNSVLNAPEKSKSKASQPQQNPSPLANLSPRANAVKPDFPRTSPVPKFQVLKPSRERSSGSPLATKDNSTSIDNKIAGVNVVLSSLSVAPPVNSRPIPPILEKRLTQARSRNDFFNLVRKNSMPNPSSIGIGPNPSEVEVVVADSSVKQSGEIDSPPSDMSVTNASTNKVDDDENNYGKTLYSEEEEAAFLRSLGWEGNNNGEDNGEDEGLTEEEISAFYKHFDEYIKQKPTSKTSQKIQPKLFGPRNSSISSDDGTTCSGSSSSDLKADS